MNVTTQPVVDDVNNIRPFPLLDLPIELISTIHSFASAHELLTRVVPTNQWLKEFILEDEQLWSSLCQRRWSIPMINQNNQRARQPTLEEDTNMLEDESNSTRASAATDWFRYEMQPAADSTTSSNTSSYNPYLLQYQSFQLTRPRPLKLRVIYLDDVGTNTFDVDASRLEEMKRKYAITNLLKPLGGAYSSCSNKNVHVILAMDDTSVIDSNNKEEQKVDSSSLTTPLLQAQSPTPATNQSTTSAASSSGPLAYPSTFLLTDFKIISPGRDYTAPLNSGFVFFTDYLPTPQQITAWDDWSEAQWIAREAEMQLNPAARLEKEFQEGIEQGDEPPPSVSTEPPVENWYDDVPQARKRVVADSYPVQFTQLPSADSKWDQIVVASADSSATSSSSSPPLAPLVGYFRLDENGKVTPEPSAAASISPSRVNQSAYSYRHHFHRPVHGRFLTLTFLRSSKEQSNIDVSYFGVKGYRRGLHAKLPTPSLSSSSTVPMEVEEKESTPSPVATVAPHPDPDLMDDGFDFDAPLTDNVELAGRLREYLNSLQRMGQGMQQEVTAMDSTLDRVQTLIQTQQRAQQQQQALRLRMLFLETQQLQLQLQAQTLQTRRTLEHATELNARAQSFMSTRTALLEQVESEREIHRQRLQELNEEKQREEALLVALRQRVQDAQAREALLREQLQRTEEERRRVNLALMERQQAARQLEQQEAGGEEDEQPDDITAPNVPQINQPFRLANPTPSYSHSSDISSAADHDGSIAYRAHRSVASPPQLFHSTTTSSFSSYAPSPIERDEQPSSSSRPLQLLTGAIRPLTSSTSSALPSSTFASVPHSHDLARRTNELLTHTDTLVRSSPTSPPPSVIAPSSSMNLATITTRGLSTETTALLERLRQNRLAREAQVRQMQPLQPTPSIQQRTDEHVQQPNPNNEGER